MKVDLLLKTYGITQKEYDKLLRSQRGVCYICHNPPKTRRLNVDHEHVKGFKKMPPAEKRNYVRGLLCFQCNRFRMAGRMTVVEAQRILDYLKRYKARKVL